MKTPRYFRSSAPDEAKLARARALRGAALAKLLRSASQLQLYDGLVKRYEQRLGLALGGEAEVPEPKPRSHWLKDALDRPAKPGEQLT